MSACNNVAVPLRSAATGISITISIITNTKTIDKSIRNDSDYDFFKDPRRKDKESGKRTRHHGDFANSTSTQDKLSKLQLNWDDKNKFLQQSELINIKNYLRT